MTSHFIVDLETLGTGKTRIPVVFNIGALRFSVNRDRDENDPYYPLVVEAEYSAHIKFDTGVCDLSTLLFWMKYPTIFAAHLSVCDAHGVSPSKAVEGLTHFMKPFVSKESTFWANGTSFDPPLLTSLYERFSDKPQPWWHWQERDLRTLLKLYGHQSMSSQLKHDGLQDCHDELKALAYLVRENKLEIR